MADKNFKVKNGLEVGDHDIVTPDGTITLPNGTHTLVPSDSPTLTGTVGLPSTTSIGNVSDTEIGYLDGVTSAIQTQLDSKAGSLVSINTQTGTSYTLALSDSNKLVEMNNAAANTLIIPLNSSVAFPIGTKIDFIQTGAGETSASPTSGVTLNSDTDKRTINAQWAAASLIKRGTDTWALIGALK